jgi:putative DNA primase/helicase
MIDLAKTETGIPIKPSRLDADPWLLNCTNGTLDLRTGTLHAHNRKHLCTKLVPVDYDPAATCPLWDKFLNRIMGNNAVTTEFLQRLIGYSLTGSIEEQVMFIAYGLDQNGKTTLFEIICTLFGDYARTADASLLLLKRGDGPRYDVARLEGARLVLTSEITASGQLDEALVKLMTGGDKITARRLYCEEEEYYSTYKIVLRTNHMPRISGVDHAIWRRLKPIPFNETIPEKEQDKKLGQKLLAELPGILAWAVRGCLDWQKNGLGNPIPRSLPWPNQSFRAVQSRQHQTGQSILEGPTCFVRSREREFMSRIFSRAESGP